MEVKWYYLHLTDRRKVKSLIKEFRDINFHYPFLTGNAVFQKNNPADPGIPDMDFYYCVNDRIGLLAEFLMDRFSSVPCEEPEDVHFVSGDSSFILQL